MLLTQIKVSQERRWQLNNPLIFSFQMSYFFFIPSFSFSKRFDFIHFFLLSFSGVFYISLLLKEFFNENLVVIPSKVAHWQLVWQCGRGWGGPVCPPPPQSPPPACRTGRWRSRQRPVPGPALENNKVEKYKDADIMSSLLTFASPHGQNDVIFHVEDKRSNYHSRQCCLNRIIIRS